MEWEQYVEIESRGFQLSGPSTQFPMDPFPGLNVGALTVARVYVQQGIGVESCHVEYEPIDEDHARILESRGWVRSDMRGDD